MKTKTNFATTSDVRNLINAVMESFPKGPVRDGIQTKMFNYWDNLNAGNNLPEGSDRKRFHAEALDNYKAAIRMAITLGSKRDSSYEFKVTELERKLSKIKVGKNEMAKVEDKFYGKRVVKGIFAKAKFDKSNYYALEGTVDGMAAGSKTVDNIEEAMYYGNAMLAHMKKQSPKAKVTTVHIYKVVNYERENKPVKVLNSRTGAKAKFAMQPNLQGMKKVRDEIYALAQTHLRLSEKSTDSQKQNYEYRIATGLSSFVSRAPYGAEIGMEFKGSAYWNKKAMQLANEGAAYGVIADKLIAEALSIYNSHSRTGSKAKFANGGTKTAAFLAKIDSKSKAMILENIAKNYGISAQAALAEITDSESENLLDYMTEPARSAASVLMQKYGSFSRNGFKARFAKEYILWAVPKGKTDTMYSQPIAEQLYTDAQINEVKRKATAAGWHTFRIAEMMSFEDMTNAFKGKPVKKRSSRTGVKARFAFNLNKKVTYLNSDNYPQSYKITDALFAKLNLRDGNSRKYLEAALKTGEAVKISRVEAIS